MMKWAEYEGNQTGGSSAGAKNSRHLLGASAQAEIGNSGIRGEASSGGESVAGEDLRPAGHRGLLAATGASLLNAFHSASPMGCPDASLHTDVILSAKTGRWAWSS